MMFVPRRRSNHVVQLKSTPLLEKTTSSRLPSESTFRLQPVTPLLLILLTTLSVWLVVTTRNNKPHIGSSSGSSSSFPAAANKQLSLARDYVNITMQMESNLFRETPSCRASPGKCRIHFPSSSSSDNNDDDYCIITKKGDKSRSQLIVGVDDDNNTNNNNNNNKMPNQDRSVLVQLGDHEQLIGLFDGHGELGHVSAHAVVQELPLQILRRLQQQQQQQNAADRPEAIKSILNESFIEMDQALIRQRLASSGTTAIVVYQTQTHLYLASAGDSTAFVAHWKNANNDGGEKDNNHNHEHYKAEILDMAVKHKPADKDERARIEAAGGQVMVPPDPNLSSRVILPDSDGGIMGMALAMSRSLGDADGKVNGYLIAEPSIRVIDLTKFQKSDHLFVVTASDGLVDFIQLEEVAQMVGEALFRNNDQKQRQVGPMCQNLVAMAVEKWRQVMSGTYRDDITLVVTKIRL